MTTVHQTTSPSDLSLCEPWACKQCREAFAFHRDTLHYWHCDECTSDDESYDLCSRCAFADLGCGSPLHRLDCWVIQGDEEDERCSSFDIPPYVTDPSACSQEEVDRRRFAIYRVRAQYIVLRRSSCSDRAVEHTKAALEIPAEVPEAVGPPCPWAKYKIPYVLKENLRRVGIAKPTTVQRALLENLGRDDCNPFIRSCFAAGKTTGICISVISYIAYQRAYVGMSSDCDPTAIILCSSSENAMRTIRTLRDLTSESGICAGIALEGKDYGSQCNKLRHSDILVGTIGRLLQITPNLGIQGVKMLVVDDAHQILDASLLERLEALKTEGVIGEKTKFSFVSSFFIESLGRNAEWYHRASQQPPLCLNHEVAIPRKIRRPKLFFKYAQNGYPDYNIIRMIVVLIPGNIVIFANTNEQVESIHEELRDIPLVEARTSKTYKRRREPAHHHVKPKQARIVITTDAFAQGENTRGVDYVIHAHLPSRPASLSSNKKFWHPLARYWERNSRANRTDRLRARSIAFYKDEDVLLFQDLATHMVISRQQSSVEGVVQSFKAHRYITPE
ncbi:P-loop containing nucleoside triphosphate hydrolase protein [Phyllosticta capitalensis]|uniref:ATP-dependent RNA helicase n=1 Tax=Phyllosticta capitalensis TaxID=121624 RepID=A0ABR1YUY1_9PEZI